MFNDAKNFFDDKNCYTTVLQAPVNQPGPPYSLEFFTNFDEGL